MGILQLFSRDEYYVEANRSDFRPGQFCWIVTPQINPVPKILDVERSSPEEHEEVSFSLREANRDGDFRRNDRVLPLKRLNLRTNEELLVQTAKKRPGVILSSDVDIIPEITKLLRQKGKKHLQEECIFVAPCYGVESEDNRWGFPPEMVTRIRYCLYRQFFYCPQNPPFLPREGVVRFDRIQVIVGRDRSAIEPLEMALSPAVLGVFMAMLTFCLVGEQNANLSAIRDLLEENYPHE